MSDSDPTGQPGAGWDEAQSTTALAHLEQLQAQIDNLRLAIPRIIEPFHRPTNPTTFKQYAQGVIGSQNGIKNLSEQWKSPEIQDTFDHIKKSFAANADLSACSSIPSYGWCERERHIRETKQSKKSDDAEDYNTSLTYEDVPRILVEFQKAHPKIKLETQEDNGSISIQFVSGSVKFKFLVNLEREASDRHKITAECSGRKEPLLAITRCIASRPKANDLGYLLEMIAAYNMVPSTSCAKCGKLLDATMLTPVARRSKQLLSVDDASKTVWEAFHENCTE